MTKAVLGLKAKTREEKKKAVGILRKQGKIPAVLYGHGIKPTNLVLDYAVFDKLYKKAGESTLVDLSINDSESVKVLIQDYQVDPVTNKFIHVDFHQVRMDEKINTEIPIKFIGDAPAIKDLSAVLVTSMGSLEVECLPNDLVSEIEVDLSSLKEFDDAIHVSDITPPPGITFKNVPQDVVALVQAPRSEQEVADAAAPVQAAVLPEGVAETPAAEEGADESIKAEAKQSSEKAEGK